RATGAHILVVEDDASTRSVLMKILTDRNYKVTEAESVRVASALAMKNDFDLVISDIGLPDGNGYELFKAIRRKLPTVRGIALTGYGSEDDRLRSRESGFDAQLTKPIRIQALETVLATVL
ncbi:MAG TPA: response regulator, partial [Verrucomicrobiae bacterium]|nr:response regulator [Verrucomicrobiae bacterium]